MLFTTARQKGTFLFAVCGVLFLCLACLELPEMSTLTDDVSNDFTILSHGSDSSEVVVCVKAAEVERKQPTSIQQIDFSARPAARPTAAPGSRDLLALHSLRRT